MQAIGIDIGTTTVSLVMVDGHSGEVLGSRTIPHRRAGHPLPGSRIRKRSGRWSWKGFRISRPNADDRTASA